MFGITPSARLRPSADCAATLVKGICALTTCNHMLTPTSFGKPFKGCWWLISGVGQWAVAVERQVPLHGPGAGRLAQIFAPRDLSNCKVGQGKYAPLVNHQGVLINDPICLKLAEDLYWLSIAAERALRVEVLEPDVFPMDIHGPKAEAVVAHLCGDWGRGRIPEFDPQGIPLGAARSGWSKQGVSTVPAQRVTGQQAVEFGEQGGPALWHRPRQSQLERAGARRVDLIQGETDAQTKPCAVRMGKYVDLHVPDDKVGIQALRPIAAERAKRHSLGLILHTGAPVSLRYAWNPIYKKRRQSGRSDQRHLRHSGAKELGICADFAQVWGGWQGSGHGRRRDAARCSDRVAVCIKGGSG